MFNADVFLLLLIPHFWNLAPMPRNTYIVDTFCLLYMNHE